ncbi:hypothetical protein J6590_084849 [Homalodisca vitripennis]|nr:hypothetical protein J6590_084849 [Homalodisca vitripennis]
MSGEGPKTHQENNFRSFLGESLMEQHTLTKFETNVKIGKACRTPLILILKHNSFTKVLGLFNCQRLKNAANPNPSHCIYRK